MKKVGFVEITEWAADAICSENIEVRRDCVLKMFDLLVEASFECELKLRTEREEENDRN